MHITLTLPVYDIG